MQEFKRDASGALLNANTDSTRTYKQQRDRANRLETDINTLKTKVAALEAIVQQLLKGIP